MSLSTCGNQICALSSKKWPIQGRSEWCSPPSSCSPNIPVLYSTLCLLMHFKSDSLFGHHTCYWIIFSSWPSETSVFFFHKNFCWVSLLPFCFCLAINFHFCVKPIKFYLMSTLFAISVNFLTVGSFHIPSVSNNVAWATPLWVLKERMWRRRNMLIFLEASRLITESTSPSVLSQVTDRKGPTNL